MGSAREDASMQIPTQNAVRYSCTDNCTLCMSHQSSLHACPSPSSLFWSAPVGCLKNWALCKTRFSEHYWFKGQQKSGKYEAIVHQAQVKLSPKPLSSPETLTLIGRLMNIIMVWFSSATSLVLSFHFSLSSISLSSLQAVANLVFYAFTWHCPSLLVTRSLINIIKCLFLAYSLHH